MLALVNFFLELCLLRRKPQDLPASPAVLGLVIVAGLLGGALLSLTAGAPLGMGLLQTALDMLLMLAALHLALRLLDKRPRFLQGATALIGADTLIGLVALLPVGMIGPSAGSSVGSSVEVSPELLLVGLMVIALAAWSVVVTAHILRHVFDVSMAMGAVIAVGFYLFSLSIFGGLSTG